MLEGSMRVLFAADPALSKEFVISDVPGPEGTVPDVPGGPYWLAVGAPKPPFVVVGVP
jgi:hypothetical protein